MNSFGQLSARGFLGLLGLLLAGYAFFGKGFAYIGAGNVFVGEMVLAFGVLTFFCGGVSLAIFRLPIVWAILAFQAWGLATTLPYIDQYGIMALRDGVLWAYSAFALFLAGSLVKTREVDTALGIFAKTVPWFLIWIPIAFILCVRFREFIPTLPGAKAPIIEIKAGDALVHLGGIGAFILLGLYRRYTPYRGGSADLRELLLLGLFAVPAFLIGSLNRGGFLAMVAALSISMFIQRSKQTLIIFFTMTLALVFISVANVDISLRLDREVSSEQIIENVESIFQGTHSSMGGTVNWRLMWWGKIIDYTIHGPYFWTGKGYGINLMKSDGTETNDTDNTRSPHNGHLTVLARSGVIGLATWILVQLAVFFRLVRSYLEARAARQGIMARINLWLLAYWFAAMINMSFDVYVEGPQGGIWFWCMIGFAIGYTTLQRNQLRRGVRRPALSGETVGVSTVRAS